MSNSALQLWSVTFQEQGRGYGITRASVTYSVAARSREQAIDLAKACRDREQPRWAIFDVRQKASESAAADLPA